MKKAFVLALILAACLAVSAGAEVPKLLNYQGVLTDGSGVAVPDNTYSIAFAIYNVPSGGSALWTETDNVVVSKGTFSVTLGTVFALGYLRFDETYYLGMSIGGGPELPRQILTASPYSLNSQSVRGLSNVFPSVGKVGIGTTSPTSDLHVYNDVNNTVSMSIENPNTGASSTERLDFTDEHGTIAAIALYDDDNPVYPSAMRIFNNRPGGNISLSTGGVGITIANGGNVGVGWTTPTEQLQVGGAIKLGTTLNSNAGTIRWTGSDFEGYNGSTWQSFTATGGGELPAGATGQTLRHNGSNWVATSSLYNNDTQIGIGTTDPTARLDVVGTGNQDIKVETSSPTGRGSLVLKSTGGSFDYLELDKYAPSTGGSTAGGIPIANLSRVAAGALAGPLMLQVITSNPMYFVTGNLERMRLDANGNLGINTTTPGAKLHVDGNQWDLTNTEGDFKIGDATYRLKFGVATGGGGAGTANIRVAGGLGRLTLGSGAAEVLGLDATGAVDIGSSDVDGTLRLFRSGVATRMLRAYTNVNGGNLDFYDELNNLAAFIEADGNGAGGYLAVYRNGGNAGFTVDGNGAGLNEPVVSITGSSQAVVFDMDQSGTQTVQLPNNAIHSAEIADEPGAASYVEGGPMGIALTNSTYNMLASRTIMAPGAGYVLVIATCQAREMHTNGTTGSADFGVSAASTSLPANQDVNWTVPSAYASATVQIPLTVHGLFSVAGGPNTFYFLGYSTTGAFYCYDFQLTLVYLPTAYGTIDPTVAGRAAGESETGGGLPLTETEVVAERSQSEAVNAARIQRELDAMHAELDAVKAKLENK